MKNFILNPENNKQEFINNLNKCFGNWGGVSTYRWAFERQVTDHTPDILLIKNEEDGVIAGSGIVYRRISDGDKAWVIGIVTGSWTLPAARKKGCLTAMLEYFRDLCAEKGIPYLTAFMTDTNPSGRRMKSLGSFLFPTHNLFSPEVPFDNEGFPGAEVLKGCDQVHREIFEVFQERQSDLLGFNYSYEEFTAQYLHRVEGTTILKVKDEYVILEDGENEIKILLLTNWGDNNVAGYIKEINNWCLKNRSKRAFFFTTGEEHYEYFENLGFENYNGYFSILRTDGGVVQQDLFAALNINMGDKM